MTAPPRAGPAADTAACVRRSLTVLPPAVGGLRRLEDLDLGQNAELDLAAPCGLEVAAGPLVVRPIV